MACDRRTFLCGALAAAVVPDALLPCPAFPVLRLEVSGRYDAEGNEIVPRRRSARRTVAVDLACEEEWGDVNPFWDGAEMAWGLGNEESGYRRIERVFACGARDGTLSSAVELTFAELAELMSVRVASWT